MKRTFTKSVLLSALFLALGTVTLHAQAIESSETGDEPGKYMIKVNLLSLPLNNYSLQFERAIGKKTAFGLGVRYMPEGGIPLASSVESLIDDPEAWNDIKDFKTGNLAITPEVRFYMGKGLFRGFYIAPFARYSKYTAELPVTFEVSDENGQNTQEMTIPLNGDLTAITGGLLFGAQWKLSRLVYLDWSILGPQYGSSSGKIIGTKSLSTEEQDALREELSSLEDLPLVNTTYSVDGNGATVDFKGPWAGVRSSFSIGFRF
jgi:hypothetical protein